MENKVCASIITYNIDEKIIEVVDSIINQVESLVIIDNNSKPETISILKELDKKDKVNLILNSTNNGIAKALNQGVEFAKKNNLKWLLTLDHDSICKKDMIKNMMDVEKQYEDKEKIAILAPQVFEVNKQDYISSKKNTDQMYTEVKDCIQSGSIFNLEIFDKIGNFNEDLFIYHVDFDYCQRVLKNDYRILQCNNTVLYHEEGYKIPKKFLGIKTFYNNYSSPAIYYITRNTIYMSKTYSPIYLKRIVKDFVHILSYDQNRFEKLKYLNKGLYDGIFNKYGKM
jgi:rhamnosyltransferase